MPGGRVGSVFRASRGAVQGDLATCRMQPVPGAAVGRGGDGVAARCCDGAFWSERAWLRQQKAGSRPSFSFLTRLRLLDCTEDLGAPRAVSGKRWLSDMNGNPAA